jgi:uncharacterized phage-associated protein
MISHAPVPGDSMAKLRFTFDFKKSTQALNFFAVKEGKHINKMKALKLVFLADRYHLRKYGRLITNDNYMAMQYGPVPSTTKNIAESNDYLDDEIRQYSQLFIEPVDNLVLVSKSDPDKTIFSETDLEALEFVWKTFGRYNQFQLRDITHTYPEWIKHKKIAESGSCSEMNLRDFLLDPTEKVPDDLKLDEAAHQIFALNEDEKQLIIETIEERSLIEAFWR